MKPVKLDSRLYMPVSYEVVHYIHSRFNFTDEAFGKLFVTTGNGRCLSTWGGIRLSVSKKLLMLPKSRLVEL